MIRLTAYVHAPHLDAAEVDALAAELRTPLDEIDALTCTIEPTRGLGRGAGELMLLAAFADAVAFERARSHPAVLAALGPMLRAADARWEGVRYMQGPVVLRRPDLVDGVQRTLLLRVRPTATPEQVVEFERQLAAMPQYIDTIRNSSLSRVDEVLGDPAAPWTHVWEQEFDDLDGLTGPYMTHAYHWSVVDPWFDPQAPNHIVDTTLVHSMRPLASSILGGAA